MPGRSSHENCDCPRCAGAQPQNTLAVTHGALRAPESLLREERTQEIAAGLIEALPLFLPSDAVQVELMAITLRRIELAASR